MGNLLCKKSRVERMAGEREAADALPDRGNEIAVTMTLGGDSGRMRPIDTARPSPEKRATFSIACGLDVAADIRQFDRYVVKTYS